MADVGGEKAKADKILTLFLASGQTVRVDLDDSSALSVASADANKDVSLQAHIAAHFRTSKRIRGCYRKKFELLTDGCFRLVCNDAQNEKNHGQDVTDRIRFPSSKIENQNDPVAGSSSDEIHHEFVSLADLSYELLLIIDMDPLELHCQQIEKADKEAIAADLGLILDSVGCDDVRQIYNLSKLSDTATAVKESVVAVAQAIGLVLGHVGDGDGKNASSKAAPKAKAAGTAPKAKPKAKGAAQPRNSVSSTQTGAKAASWDTLRKVVLQDVNFVGKLREVDVTSLSPDVLTSCRSLIDIAGPHLDALLNNKRETSDVGRLLQWLQLSLGGGELQKKERISERKALIAEGLMNVDEHDGTIQLGDDEPDE